MVDTFFFLHDRKAKYRYILVLDQQVIIIFDCLTRGHMGTLRKYSKLVRYSVQELVLGIGPKIENRLSERFSIRLSIWNRFFSLYWNLLYCIYSGSWTTVKNIYKKILTYFASTFLTLRLGNCLIWLFQWIRVVFSSLNWVVILLCSSSKTKDMTKRKIEKNRFWKRHNRSWNMPV